MVLVAALTDLFTALALMYHASKSHLTPSTTITHLGFELNITEHKYYLSLK